MDGAAEAKMSPNLYLPKYCSADLCVRSRLVTLIEDPRAILQISQQFQQRSICEYGAQAQAVRPVRKGILAQYC